jgi:hypothetical protein
MKNITRILIVGCFSIFCMAVYAGSTIGWGVSDIKDHKTMAEIKKDCPDHYTNQNGECVQSRFRSVYFLRTGYSDYGGK